MSINSLERFFSSSDFMPHIHCYLAKPSLVWTMFTTDLLIGISYVIISFSLYRLVRRIQLPFSPMFLAFGLFIFACGLTHFMEVYTLWRPEYWIAAFIKVVTAAASVLTAIFLIRLNPKIVSFAAHAKKSEERRIQLQKKTEELEATQVSLKYAHDELESRVKDRTAELESTLQSRDDFLSVASHELKTPLTAIFMQLQLLQRRLQRTYNEGRTLAPADLQKMDLCLDQSSKLSILIDELLDLTRIRAGRLNLSLEEVDLGELVEDVVERLNEPLLKNEKSRIQIQAPMEGLVGEWDRMRLEQIITNLLSNALKYGNGKPITITLESANENEEIKLIVKDEGIGMSKELQQKIFERFARGSYDNKISGLGLGLYITKQIIEAHHGRVELKSSEGKGSEFKIFLPVHPQLHPQINQGNKGEQNEMQEHSHH